MRIGSIALAVVVTAIPLLGAVSVKKPRSTVIDTETSEVAGIIATLHMVENRLLHDLATGEITAQRVTKIIELIKMPSGPICDPGFCLEEGICVPCDPTRHGMSIETRVLAIVATLHMFENRLIQQFTLKSKGYKDTITGTRNLAAALRAQGPGGNQCEPGSCPFNGICIPCRP